MQRLQTIHSILLYCLLFFEDLDDFARAPGVARVVVARCAIVPPTRAFSFVVFPVFNRVLRRTRGGTTCSGSGWVAEGGSGAWERGTTLSSSGSSSRARFLPWDDANTGTAAVVCREGTDSLALEVGRGSEAGRGTSSSRAISLPLDDSNTGAAAATGRIVSTDLQISAVG